jgi:hypothetical protein
MFEGYTSPQERLMPRRIECGMKAHDRICNSEFWVIFQALEESTALGICLQTSLKFNKDVKYNDFVLIQKVAKQVQESRVASNVLYLQRRSSE